MSAARTQVIPRRLAAAWPYLVAALLALPAGLHLLRAGFWTSGDGLHHLHRVARLTDALAAGVLYPRWIGEFSFGYGAPVFNFYSPLSYYLAQLFASLGPLWAMKLTMLAGLLASAALLYHFAQAHVGRWPALAAAAVYALAPYRFVDLYPRAALAEHLAFVWLPLILWAFNGAWVTRRRAWQVLGWAGLVLTHSFTALMFAPFFALYLAWQWAAQRRQGSAQSRPLAALAALAALARPLLLAILITAFFWLPLGLEARFAGLGAGEVGEGYKNHLVSLGALGGPLLFDYGTGGGREDYYFAFGLLPTLLLLASVPALLLARRPGDRCGLAAFGAVTGVGALFLVSRASTPVWELFAPLLANIQFPWRFLSIATLGAALAATALVGLVRAPRGQALAVLVLAAALYATSAARLPFEPMPLAGADVTPEHLWAFDSATGQVGTTWGGEFIPTGVTEQRWALGRAAAHATDGPAQDRVAVSDVVRRGAGYAFTAAAAAPWTFRLHAYYFPGWQVRVDGAAVPTAATGDLGLVTARIPAGAHRVSVAFEPTPPRTAARWLTVAGLLLWGVWSARCGRGFRPAPLAVAGAAALVVLVSPLLPRTTPVQPVAAVFGDRAQLVGATVAPGAVAGGELAVELLWLAQRPVSTNDKAFVHLVDVGGQVVAQSDSDPGGGYTPTTRWQAGELIPDRHRLTLPAELPAGAYRILAGLYSYEPFANLLTEPAAADGRVLVGEVTVR